MFGRRLLVLVAILMGLTALAASLAPPPPQGGRERPGRPSSPAPPATATAAPLGGGTVTARLSAAPSARPHEVTAARGDLVNLTVSGDVIDTVAIDPLAVLEPIAPSSPARVELYADTPGRFPIRLVDADRRIGTLLVSG